jgi:hypothetical protein
MFIPRYVLKPLQNEYPSTLLGKERSRWFVYALLSFIVSFTSTLSQKFCLHYWQFKIRKYNIIMNPFLMAIILQYQQDIVLIRVHCGSQFHET